MICGFEFGFRKSGSKVEKPIIEAKGKDFCQKPISIDVLLDFCLGIWYKRYCGLTPAVFV